MEHPDRADQPLRHHHARSFEANRKGLIIAIAVTGGIMIVEFAGGLLANSLALLSDAGHMLTDVLALALSLAALYFATRPPSDTKTYGFYRMEILAALVNGTSLILISILILVEAYRRFRAMESVDSHIMLIIAAVGLVANGIAAAALMRSSGESLNIRGAYLHILGDALSSIGVIIGGVVIMLTGWFLVDPLISVMICVVILRGAFVLVRDSVNILLEAVPKNLNIARVQEAITVIEGVKDLHDLHLWTITSRIYAMSAHILVDDMLMSRSGEILREVTETLRDRFGIAHTTIQLECENCEEGLQRAEGQTCVMIAPRGPNDRLWEDGK